MAEYHTIKIAVRVYDKTALHAAAIARAISEGMTADDAAKLLHDEAEDGPDVGACLQMLFDPGESPDGASIEESSCDLDDIDDEDDEDDEPQDFSGNDPGYKLVKSDGPVILTLEEADNVISRKAAFATIADAVAYLGLSRTIDPVDLKAGRYGIDAPHGLGDDSEAVPLATSLGFQIFWSMGAACWAPKGVAISGNVSGKGWRTGFDTLDAAALAALATVEP